MKYKFVLSGFLIILSCCSINAQKIYSTKVAQVKFLSSTAAEDIDAVNNQAESKLIDKGQIMFGLLIKGFVFDNALMQKHFNGAEYMDSDKYPKAEFKGTIANIATVNFTKDGAYPLMATGNLLIKGISKKQSAAGLIIIEKGKVTSKSTFKIKLKDYGITGKDIGSVISNDIQITVEAKYE
jgi:hypothetical protein